MNWFIQPQYDITQTDSKVDDIQTFATLGEAKKAVCRRLEQDIQQAQDKIAQTQALRLSHYIEQIKP